MSQEVRVDNRVRWNKFMVINPLHIEKKMNLLFVELWTCPESFALGDCGVLPLQQLLLCF
jgi:hypothetical protein